MAVRPYTDAADTAASAGASTAIRLLPRSARLQEVN